MAKEERKRVGIMIKEEDVPVWESLKSVVIEKHGKLQGVFADEVVSAVKLYLEHEKVYTINQKI